MTHIAFEKQRKQNLKKWLLIEGSKPEYKNRFVPDRDEIVKLEIYLEKLYGTAEEIKFAEKVERLENITKWEKLNKKAEPIIAAAEEKPKRARIKSAGIKIPKPIKHKTNSNTEKCNQKINNKVPVNKDNWKEFWNEETKYNHSVKTK